MARVTVEDCIEIVQNRFELVMLAAQRARSLSAGAELTLDRDNDKNPVVALREIAEKNLDLDNLEAGLVKGLQKHIESDEPDEAEMDLLTAGENFGEALNQDAAPSLNQPVAETADSSVTPMPVFNDDVLPVDTNTLPNTE